LFNSALLGSAYALGPVFRQNRSFTHAHTVIPNRRQPAWNLLPQQRDVSHLSRRQVAGVGLPDPQSVEGRSLPKLSFRTG